uniref:Adhesion G protein-coupled receptor B2 n=1 Tax=Otus sunia TaxID=257818 RepID=A0A8C8AR84_9STRI
MTAAGPLLLAVISSLLWLTRGFDPAPSACSALASGVLYGSFSLKDLFPTISSGCSWTLENPDPTKYSLYLRFNREEQVCTHFSPMVLPLDHYLEAELELCEGAGPFTFLHFDKNFVQLCLAAEPEAAPRLLAPQALEFRFVEVLLINNNNSSQFTCSVLCRWLEECLQAPGARRSLISPVLLRRSPQPRSVAGAGARPAARRASPLPAVAGGVPPSGVPGPSVPWGQGWSRGEAAPALGARGWEAWMGVGTGLRLCGVTLGTSQPCNGGVFGGGTPPPEPAALGTSSSSLTCFKAVFPLAQTHHPAEPASRGGDARTRLALGDTLGSVFPTGDPAAEEWSQWSVCSLTCGQGSQVRTRSCVSSPYGTLCSGLLRETRTCNNTATCPVHGAWEEWSPWSLCSVTCGRGARTRTRRCVAPRRGGKACEGPELQAKPCNIATCLVEGQWLEWGAWSRCSVTCANGTQQRTRKCSVSAHGWAECRGAHADARECSNPTCPTDSKWGPWNHWSLCSKTCDTGWQRRFRMCEGTGVQGYPCEGSGEEVKTCNEKKCPAYHEMCKDEYVMLMTWKKTAAGEVTYNKCPPNATGSASRRCLLSPHGVAYWGVPSFARCVSHEYRYLHLSVGARSGRAPLGACVRARVNVHMWLHIWECTHVNRHIWESAPTRERARVCVCTSVNTRELAWPGLCMPASVQAASCQLTCVGVGVCVPSTHVWVLTEPPRVPGTGSRRRFSFSPLSAETEESSHFVIGAVLYRTLGLILPPPRTPLAVTSKVLMVTVRPPTKPAEPLVLVELSHIINVSVPLAPCHLSVLCGSPQALRTRQGPATLPAHTKCQCRQLATFAVLAQLPRDLAMDPSGTPSVPLMIGCAVSCMALLTLLVIYAAFWRFIKSERSIILLNFCVSILASNILILVGQSQMLSKGVCTMTAAFLHFFFLSSFCWVLTEAWQSYLAVIGRIRTRLVRKRFLCLGWGLPALVVAVSVGFTRTKGYGTASYCWLSLEGGLLYAFVGPAAVIVLVNMLVGIIVFNKLMSRDGISDKSKKQRAGASLWSSCVVLPLLALTWMSAVLAMTDRRSILFQVLFAVFNSVQGFVIITVHGFLRREVQDVVKCQMGGCRSEENENSPDSCKNGQVQILTDFEKDVDLACQTVLFKEVNTCNPATITGTLSRISLDGDEDPKLNTTSEGGLGFSSLPGNIPPTSILVQVPKMTPNVVAGLSDLGDPPAQPLSLEAPGPVYLCTESSLRPLDYGWLRAPEPPRESDYMMLPRRTGSLKPFPREEGTLGPGTEEGVPGGTGRPVAEGDAYPGFVAVDHPPCPRFPLACCQQRRSFTPGHNKHWLVIKTPAPSRGGAAGSATRLHPLPRVWGCPGWIWGVRRGTGMGKGVCRGAMGPCWMLTAALTPQKVMHTRKRHSELYHELNQKFHTLDRYRAPAAGSSKVRSWGSHPAPAPLHLPPAWTRTSRGEWGETGHPGS